MSANMTSSTQTIVQVAEQDSFRDRLYAEYVSSFKGRPDADGLATHYKCRARINDKLFGKLIANVLRDCAIEVGCGDGSFLSWARQLGFRTVAGCDLSAEQVAIAREAGLPAEYADFRDFLPQFKEKADLLFAQDVLEHLTPSEGLELLELARRSLKPGGTLLLTMPNAAAIRPGPVLFGDLSHMTHFTPSSLTSMLRLARFDEVCFREVSPPLHSMKSVMRAALWQLLRTAASLVDMIETGATVNPRVYSRVMIVKASVGT